MAKVTLKGNEIHTNGELPKVGTEAPDFKGVKSDLSELSLSDLKGKMVSAPTRIASQAARAWIQVYVRPL